MSNNKGRSTPRVVCCAIPISRSTNQVLVITSRKRSNQWVCEYPLPRRPSPVPLPHPFLSSTRASTRPLTDVSHEPHDTHDARLRSTQRRVGAIGRGARSSSLKRSLGRRSHPLLLYPSPTLSRTSPLLFPTYTCIRFDVNRNAMARQPIAFTSTRLPRTDARLPQKISGIENRNHHAQTTNSTTSTKKMK